MNAKTDIIGIIEQLRSLNSAIEKAQDTVYEEHKKTNSYEYNRILCILESSEDYDIGCLLDRLEYFTKSTREGDLILQSNDRYKISFWENEEFTSGRLVEILYHDKYDGWIWLDGRVEYSNDMGGYYFLNHTGKSEDKIKLYHGMRARIRE